MPSPAASTALLRNVLRRFRRNRRGSAAVEFALVAPVFFALLFAIIETALVFFAGQVLETITQNSARIDHDRAGADRGLHADRFQNQGCLPARSPHCSPAANVYVDVQSYPAFSNVTINSQIDASNNFISNMQYNPGGPGQIVVVRLFYQWPLFVTGLGYNIANLAGSKRLLSATAAFQNEPY